MNNPKKQRKRRLRIGGMPDPAKAHGAWAYLLLSVLAGTLTATGRGIVPALLVGIGFAGVFLCASALAIAGKPAMERRLALGALLAVAGPGAALYLGASPSFFAYGVVALAPAALSGYYAEKLGAASAQTKAFAVVTLGVAAPSAACAGGASLGAGLLLLTLLAPFFAYRAWTVSHAVTNQRGWNKAKLKKQGIREGIYGITWTIFVVLIFHLIRFLTTQN